MYDREMKFLLKKLYPNKPEWFIDSLTMITQEINREHFYWASQKRKLARDKNIKDINISRIQIPYIDVEKIIHLIELYDNENTDKSNLIIVKDMLLSNFKIDEHLLTVEMAWKRHIG